MVMNVSVSPPNCSDEDFDPFLDEELENIASINKRPKLHHQCSHPEFFAQLCTFCGAKSEDLDYDSRPKTRMIYIQKDLSVSNAGLERVRKIDTKNLLRRKKLILVLDLDHTLLHTTTRVEYPANDMEEGGDDLFVMPGMMTKLRPFVREFLKEANTMFEMYIYTMGDTHYAAAMATLLDPKKEYLVDRVISQDESTKKDQKGLDLVLGQESCVVILDDTEAVWSRHADNMILIRQYKFFDSRKSLAELRTDGNESDGILATILQVLKRVHATLFCTDIAEDLDLQADRDVRQILKSLRSEILKGCKIVFSRVFPLRVQAETHVLWRVAEALGATCCTEVDPSVTHVVAGDAGTVKARWAEKENKFLVNPQWIEEANFLWKRLPEDNFPVNSTKK